MPCLLPLAPAHRPRIIASVCRPPHCKDRFLAPRTRRRLRLRLGVSMAEMARVGSGASPEVGVSGESDAILGGEESPGARREAARWVPVETALNRMVSVSWDGAADALVKITLA
uniref:Uncharacterized protein n=1 Tax=Arundo donax TaxID=35708 RepID=A0A0A9DQT9_ARUDO